MMKRDGYLVFMYRNTVRDLFDAKRWEFDIHDVLKEYIQKWYRPDGVLFRTKGRAASKTLAIKIFTRFVELVQEDIFENQDEFHLEQHGFGYIRAEQQFRFRPSTLNKTVIGKLYMTDFAKEKIGYDYLFMPNKERRLKLKEKLKVHGN